jgi:exopolysaccharide biosynthesis polyprenyl glycosylphosphotransferase
LKKVENALKNFDLFIVDDSFTVEEKSELLKFFAYRDKPVYLVPGVYELMLLNPRTHFVNDLTLFEINLVNISGVEKIVKRAMDIIVSLVALIIFSPVILVVSLGIIFDSGRPVFFLQDRVGVNGKVFKTIKFRTMIKDAEKYTGPVLSSEDDPRITKIGKFLRKTGLDEVPQFINVLKGDLSVVGPRPERPELMEKIKEDTPNFDMRLKVKPGITGFAQLQGKYDTPFDKKLEMDLLYVKEKNTILTDIYVMFNTVKLFLSPKKRK